jgi:hypothetical protein
MTDIVLVNMIHYMYEKEKIMNVWIVIDRYDHSESITTAHLTEKGALIEAYRTLLESYDNCIEQPYAISEGWANEFEEEYPDAHKFIEQHRSNIAEAKTADLDKHFGHLQCWVGEQTEWNTDITIQTTRLQA